MLNHAIRISGAHASMTDEILTVRIISSHVRELRCYLLRCYFLSELLLPHTPPVLVPELVPVAIIVVRW